MPLDLDLIVNKVSAQDTENILKIDVALSKRPHLHKAHIVNGSTFRSECTR